jgi:hypothetical protein
MRGAGRGRGSLPFLPPTWGCALCCVTVTDSMCTGLGFALISAICYICYLAAVCLNTPAMYLLPAVSSKYIAARGPASGDIAHHTPKWRPIK